MHLEILSKGYKLEERPFRNTQVLLILAISLLKLHKKKIGDLIWISNG